MIAAAVTIRLILTATLLFLAFRELWELGMMLWTFLTLLMLTLANEARSFLDRPKETA